MGHLQSDFALALSSQRPKHHYTAEAHMSMALCFYDAKIIGQRTSLEDLLCNLSGLLTFMSNLLACCQQQQRLIDTGVPAAGVAWGKFLAAEVVQEGQ